MRVYFRDNEGNVRAAEGEFGHTVDDQKRLQTYVRAGTSINAKLPILEALNPGYFEKVEDYNEG